jgi:hypothetical protein
MISVTKIVVTMEAFLLVVGKASTHPVKVSTNTRRYLILFTGGICVKSTCHGREASPGLVGRKGKGSNIGVGVCVLAD